MIKNAVLDVHIDDFKMPTQIAMKRINYLLISSMLLLNPFRLFSQLGTAGQSYEFLRYPACSRQISLGGAGVSVPDGASALYWNPSLLSCKEKINLVAYLNGLGYGSYHSFIALSYPTRIFNKPINLGVGFVSHSMDGFKELDQLGRDLNNQFSWKSMAVNFGLAYFLPNTKTAIGLTYKRIYEQMTSFYKKETNAWDIGIYQIINKYIDGIGIKMQYTPHVKDLRIGMSKHFIEPYLLLTSDLLTVWQHEPNTMRSLSYDWCIGIESQPFDGIKFRAGYQVRTNAVRFGIGFSYPIDIDYSFGYKCSYKDESNFTVNLTIDKHPFRIPNTVSRCTENTELDTCYGGGFTDAIRFKQIITRMDTRSPLQMLYKAEAFYILSRQEGERRNLKRAIDLYQTLFDEHIESRRYDFLKTYHVVHYMTALYKLGMFQKIVQNTMDWAFDDPLWQESDYYTICAMANQKLYVSDNSDSSFLKAIDCFKKAAERSNASGRNWYARHQMADLFMSRYMSTDDTTNLNKSIEIFKTMAEDTLSRVDYTLEVINHKISEPLQAHAHASMAEYFFEIAWKYEEKKDFNKALEYYNKAVYEIYIIETYFPDAIYDEKEKFKIKTGRDRLKGRSS